MSTPSELGMEPQHKQEGRVTHMIESRTARVPSGAYFGLAFGSMIASAVLMLSGRRTAANFIGQWVPSLLVIGVYNKLVKIESEMFSEFERGRVA